MSNLTALRGRHAGEVYVLAVGQNTIGRDISNDVCLHDPSVSSRHAILTIEADVASLHEVKSRNGIIVNGERVSEMSLKTGDRILLGSSLLEYRATLPSRALAYCFK